MSDRFDHLEALKLRALRSVWKPDEPAIVRRIFRWYSKTFFTPLHEVDSIPLDDILTAWFETQYEDLEYEARHNLAIYLLESPEERRAREAESKSADEEFFLMAKKKALSSKTEKKLADKVADLKKKLDKIKNPNEFKPLKDQPMRESELVKLPPVAAGGAEEIVTISYTDQPFDDEEDPLSPSPPKKP